MVVVIYIYICHWNISVYGYVASFLQMDTICVYIFSFTSPYCGILVLWLEMLYQDAVDEEP